MADRVDELLEAFIAQHVCPRIAPALRSLAFFVEKSARPGIGKSIHEISKRDVVELISAIEQRGTPVAANKTLKSD